MKITIIYKQDSYSKLAIYKACRSLLSSFYAENEEFDKFKDFVKNNQNIKLHSFDAVLLRDVWVKYSINNFFSFGSVDLEIFCISKNDESIQITISYGNPKIKEYEFMRLIKFNSLLQFADSITIDRDIQNEEIEYEVKKIKGDKK